MKKVFLFLFVTVLLTSCYKDPQSSEKTGIDIQVDFLFEKDGVKVYRFFDGGHAHYFTTQGETISPQKSGKSEYDENIKTPQVPYDKQY